MLRTDNKAQLVKLPWTLRRMISGRRYAVQSGRKSWSFDGRPKRVGIPTELRRTVFERDGGNCAECGGNFDLLYDHILPVTRGGATTLENLQLLCAECNRSKSDSI